VLKRFSEKVNVAILVEDEQNDDVLENKRRQANGSKEMLQ
jgi:hypothetical protein